MASGLVCTGEGTKKKKTSLLALIALVEQTQFHRIHAPSKLCTYFRCTVEVTKYITVAPGQNTVNESGIENWLVCNLPRQAHLYFIEVEVGKLLCIDDKKLNYASVGYKFNGSGLLKAKSHTRVLMPIFGNICTYVI